MNALKFNRLFVQSTTQNLANRFRFGSGLNLITGDDNSIGKSTFARLPLWALGCDFKFDEDWRQHDARVILTFSVGDSEYAVARHRNSIFLKIGEGDWRNYEKISGEYAQEFAKIVGFGALLPRKGQKWIHEVPPPAYYFSAFYVDQRKGWVAPWSSFTDFRYEQWRRPVISFHAGYLKAEHYQLGAGIAEGQQAIEENVKVVEKYSRAVEVLKLLAPPDELPITDKELDSAIQEIQHSMVAVKRREQRALASLTARQEELELTKVQKGIAEAAVADLEKDYDFAVNNLSEDMLVCPLCATVHDNSLLNRAAILQDRQQALAQVAKLTEHQAKVESAIASALRRLESTRDDLSKLNRRFKRLDKDVSVKSLLEGMGTASIKSRANTITTEASARITAAKASLRSRRREQKEMEDRDLESSINGYFRTELSLLCKNLRIQPGFDIETITPFDYNELAERGGAADNSRLQLAYHLAIHRLVQHFKTEALSPLILDTPNQQDQGALNYGLVSSELKKRATDDTQIIVCATRHKDMHPLELGSTVFELGPEKLFAEDMNEKLAPMFARVFGGTSI
ncbi:hypothetical protein [Pandoraea communis]|uniref:hypothetical protein n=1 Tax=Pandoraea communis TaxID=2508297 RepID=UPI0025A61265|nr:hypothetical protein [Pandoraea communis]MDM8358680.1 hypothetical protein [Pandoraea communis]